MDVVQQSAQCNEAQLVVDELGNTVVPCYDWSTFLISRFKKLPGIKKGHHFRIPDTEPGVVYVKSGSDGEEKRHSILKPSVTIAVDEFPELLEPAGSNSPETVVSP